MVQLNMYNSDKFKSLNSVTLMQDVFCLNVLCFKFKYRRMLYAPCAQRKGLISQLLPLRN